MRESSFKLSPHPRVYGQYQLDSLGYFWKGHEVRTGVREDGPGKSEKDIGEYNQNTSYCMCGILRRYFGKYLHQVFKGSLIIPIWLILQL